MSPAMADPSLDELVRDPNRAANLPPEARASVLLRCAAVLAALSAPMVDLTVVAQHVPTRPEQATDDTQLLTAAQVAERTGFARSYVYQLLRRGELRAVRRGKYVRVTVAALQAWIASHSADWTPTKLRANHASCHPSR